jgi:hypothetical protein
VTYLRARADRLRAGRPEEKAKKSVSKWLDENGETDADGNIFYRFPAPVADTDGKLYAGVHKRFDGDGDPYFIREEVEARFQDSSMLNKYYDEVFPLVRIFSTEALYLLEQRGLISKATVKELLHDGEPKYSLWPIPYDAEDSDE